MLLLLKLNLLEEGLQVLGLHLLLRHRLLLVVGIQCLLLLL